MEHVAIDLGGRESQICVRSSDGKIQEERRWATHLCERPCSMRYSKLAARMRG